MGKNIFKIIANFDYKKRREEFANKAITIADRSNALLVTSSANYSYIRDLKADRIHNGHSILMTYEQFHSLKNVQCNYIVFDPMNLSMKRWEYLEDEEYINVLCGIVEDPDLQEMVMYYIRNNITSINNGLDISTIITSQVNSDTLDMYQTIKQAYEKSLIIICVDERTKQDIKRLAKTFNIRIQTPITLRESVDIKTYRGRRFAGTITYERYDDELVNTLRRNNIRPRSAEELSNEIAKCIFLWEAKK